MPTAAVPCHPIPLPATEADRCHAAAAWNSHFQYGSGV